MYLYKMMCIYMHIYVYAYVYMYIYIYIHMCVWLDHAAIGQFLQMKATCAYDCGPEMSAPEILSKAVLLQVDLHCSVNPTQNFARIVIC